MRSPNKWFVSVSPDREVSVAAKKALQPRFKALREHLSLAAERADEDVEHVHQLRVAVRRADAAVRLFQDMLPGRRRRLKNKCRLIRRAAGPARDLDVLSAWLTETAVPAELEQARTACLQHATELRIQAQEELRVVHAQFPEEKLKRQMRSLLKDLRGPSNGDREPTFAEDASQRLAPIGADFLAAAQTDGADLAQLHQLRIQGKRLRYALEALAGAFPSEPFHDLYAAIRDLQERLGTINDRRTAEQYLEEWGRENHPEQAPLLQVLKQQNAEALETARHACAAWWTAERMDAVRARLMELAPAIRPTALPPKLYESA